MSRELSTVGDSGCIVPIAIVRFLLEQAYRLLEITSFNCLAVAGSTSAGSAFGLPPGGGGASVLGGRVLVPVPTGAVVVGFPGSGEPGRSCAERPEVKAKYAEAKAKMWDLRIFIFKGF